MWAAAVRAGRDRLPWRREHSSSFREAVPAVFVGERQRSPWPDLPPRGVSFVPSFEIGINSPHRNIFLNHRVQRSSLTKCLAVYAAAVTGDASCYQEMNARVRVPFDDKSAFSKGWKRGGIRGFPWLLKSVGPLFGCDQIFPGLASKTRERSGRVPAGCHRLRKGAGFSRRHTRGESIFVSFLLTSSALSVW